MDNGKSTLNHNIVKVKCILLQKMALFKLKNEGFSHLWNRLEPDLHSRFREYRWQVYSRFRIRVPSQAYFLLALMSMWFWLIDNFVFCCRHSSCVWITYLDCPMWNGGGNGVWHFLWGHPSRIAHSRFCSQQQQKSGSTRHLSQFFPAPRHFLLDPFL